LRLMTKLEGPSACWTRPESAGLGALEDLSRVMADQAKGKKLGLCAIADQSARQRRIHAHAIDRRNGHGAMPSAHRSASRRPGPRNGSAADDEARPALQFDEGGGRRLSDLAFAGPGFQDMELQPPLAARAAFPQRLESRASAVARLFGFISQGDHLSPRNQLSQAAQGRFAVQASVEKHADAREGCRPGRARLATSPSPTGSAPPLKDDRDRRGSRLFSRLGPQAGCFANDQIGLCGRTRIGGQCGQPDRNGPPHSGIRSPHSVPST